MTNHLRRIWGCVRRIWGCVANILAPVLGCTLFILFLTSLYVMFCDDQWWIRILDMESVKIKPSPKFVALEFLGAVMGGIVLALLAATAHRRAKAMEDSANAQADAVKKTEKGQIHERLKIAVEHLGKNSDSVRFGAVYELFHLAKDEKDLRGTVLDIICVHIRQNTGTKCYQCMYMKEPSEEIKNVVRLIFVDNGKIFKGLPANLRGSWLNGVDLSKGCLKKAILTDAKLNGANLRDTELQGAYLTDAELWLANMQNARMQWTDLVGAQMQGADLTRAQMQGVYLGNAKLQVAILTGADMRGATNRTTSEEFGERINRQTSKCTKLIDEGDGFADVIFEGGLDQSDIDDKSHYILDDPRWRCLREKLENEIGKKCVKPDNEYLHDCRGIKVGNMPCTDAGNLET